MNEQVIQFRGTIYENGYGLIAQKVMRDRNLSSTAKSIYAYICSFAGVGKDGERTAFPGVNLMMSELNIKSRDTLYRHRNQLIKHGYLTIEKIRKEGKFQNNIYYIEAIPEVKEEKEEKQPYPKNQTTAPCPKKSTTEKSTTKNKDTNINRSYHYQFKEEEEYINKGKSIFETELVNYLRDKNIKEKTINKILMALKKKNLTKFSLTDVDKQYKHMMDLSKHEIIYDFATYFVNGLERLAEISKSRLDYENKKLRDKTFLSEHDKSLLNYDWVNN